MSSRPARFAAADLVAGVSVALVLVPQALAYAELAGLEAGTGLLAAALPPIAAAFLASSPFLQTGPTAMVSLLTFGVLAQHFQPFSAQFAGAAALLALLVGVMRLALGLARFGALAYFMSQPVLQGFTSAAALLIVASQLPAALGLPAAVGNPLLGLLPALAAPDAWDPLALAFTLGTIAVVAAVRQLSPLLPGVLLAVVLGLLASVALGYAGPTVGEFGPAWPSLRLDLPWGAVGDLLLGAAVIAVVGFAEPAAIARAYAGRRGWDPDRELLGQGVANLAAGLVGAFPVGGSFSRSALARDVGAASRWSGLFAGLAVLAFLPFAALLAPLPKAVLAGIVIVAVARLLQPLALLRLWRYARLQALTSYATFALTLLLAPRIDVAVVMGIALAVAAHLYREMQLGVSVRRDGDALVVSVSGVLWFGSVQQLEARLRQLLPPPAGVRRLVIDGAALGRVDLSGALLLDELLRGAEELGLEVGVVGLRPHMQRVLERVRRR